MAVDIYNNGLVFGLISGFIFCLTLKKFFESRRNIGARNRPLNTFPDAAQGNLTAAKINRQSRMGKISIVFWLFILIAEIVTFISVVGQNWNKLASFY